MRARSRHDQHENHQAYRVVDGVTLPAAGTWEIDPGHADVAFIGRHFIVTKVRGRFTDVRGAVTFEGYARDPWGGGDRAVFSARTQVNREDFGVTWNVTLETGGVLVRKEIKIEIEVETVLRHGDASSDV